LAREAAARTEQTAERERRRELLEPLLALASAREHARDVENYIIGFTKESPACRPILREDLRWRAVASARFQAALRQWEVKARPGNALAETDVRDDDGTPFAHISTLAYQLNSAVLELHQTAEDYIRDGPDKAS